MAIDVLRGGKWVPLRNATAVDLGDRYEVTITGLPYATGKDAYDGTRLRIDGMESQQVVGVRKMRAAGVATTTLVLQVLV